ncbi:MAG: hypothetical protein KHX03_02330 [Clostridium sp.]|nr:hypothetical protein [Clostridium sp.]
MKKLIIKFFLLSSFIFSSAPSYAYMNQGVWINDMKSLFARNQAVILAINIRTFNANDKDKNDIVEIEKGETPGYFTNALKRLPELQKMNINTVHLLPITPVGKVKATGTAGSLYAISSFTKLNPQLDDPSNDLTVSQEAKKFIDECHKRNIRVIVDLPSCGSYDLYLSNPNLFAKGKDGQPIVPADWTDVRLFKVQNEDGSLNDELYLEYKKYVDMMQKLGVDGIRADVATSKPFEFWQKLISYAKSKDKEFLFLAEASESWTDPIAQEAPFTPYYRLLEAGFDGWYGSFMNFKDWKTSDKFEKEMGLVNSIKKEFAAKNQPKNVIGSFATHDELSPIITGGMPFSEMIIWLQATLPLNSYFVDGFQTGDSYQYQYANQKADKTYTDDDYYYVHKGKFDIFNYSRKPGQKNEELSEDFALANKFKLMSSEILSKGEIKFLKTNCENVFAYMIHYNASSILVILNKDLVYQNKADVSLKGFAPDKYMVVPFKINSNPVFKNGKVSVDLGPGEITVILLSKNAAGVSKK